MRNNFMDDGPQPEKRSGKAQDKYTAAFDDEAGSHIEIDGVKGRKKKSGKGWGTKRIVIVSIVGALVLILAGGGAWAYSIWSNPMSQFNNIADQITPPPSETAEATPEAGVAATPGPTPTIDPYQQLLSQSDTSFLKDTINILLIGVDHAVERDTWSGKKAFHSDVMIVLAVNKTTGAVNMISLPRDTYANIPGVDGIYKLNASIDCGGGWPTDGGFNKVCEAASWMLGGIPVQYYYAVDMNAVKDLVNGIGGVQNFDIEMDFKMQGRSYKKGVQDMDGQAVLDYLRVRKYIAESGDLNRINRQKKMLVAIFNKIKQNGLLTSIPGMLDAFQGNMYTNTTLAQTAALAAFAYNVEPDSIGMYSMGGYYKNIFNWNFVLTDQKARVALIKQIYGVDVDQYKDYTGSAAAARWENMRAPVIKSQAESALSKVKTKLDADAKLPVYVEPTPTPSPTPKPTPKTASKPTPKATPMPSESSGDDSGAGSVGITPLSLNLAGNGITQLNAGTGVSSSHISLETGTIPAGYRQYPEGGQVWALYNKAVAACKTLGTQSSTDAKKAANDQVVADVNSLCNTFGISLSSSYWRVNYEKNSNEIWVDFN